MSDCIRGAEPGVIGGGKERTLTVRMWVHREG